MKRGIGKHSAPVNVWSWVSSTILWFLITADYLEVLDEQAIAAVPDEYVVSSHHHLVKVRRQPSCCVYCIE